MIRVADYIMKYLAAQGVRDVFMITGGGAMHLNDAVGRSPDITYICNHHEQACAIAAEGYARITGKFAVVIVTTGPGGTNTLTGVLGQWLDSVPVLYISGQVKFETTTASMPGLKLRQIGDQEINIVDIVRPLTKFSKMVTDPKDILRSLQKAVYFATHGRPGPVWLDIPINVQGALIDEKDLAPPDIPVQQTEKPHDINFLINEVLSMLKNAVRPVLIVGQGIRISGGVAELNELIEKIKIPTVTSFLGCDLVESSSPYFIGRIGTIGNRPGNFAIQNADLLITIGTRNNIRQTSYNWDWFGRNAKKVVVDIDESELKKPTFKPDLAICCDAKLFIKMLLDDVAKNPYPDWSEWVGWNLIRKEKYPAYLPEYANVKNRVHPYHFINSLTQMLGDDDIVVTANATPSIIYHQLGIVKKNQRVIWNSGCASMGYGLPAAIGAAFGSDKKRKIICLEGDGSLQLNIQELQTLLHHHLPIKLFVLDNGGYISIKQTQTNMFNGYFVGIDADSGVSFPDYSKIAKAYGLKVEVIKKHKGMLEKLEKVLNTEGPVLCHVLLIKDYIFSPKTSSERLPDGQIISKPLEDMFPFLDRDEFAKNMINK